MSKAAISLRILFALAVLGPLQTVYAAGDVADRVEKPVRKAIDVRQETQEARTRWLKERQRLVAEYDQLQKDRSRLEEQRDALEQIVAAARVRVGEKEKQLADVEQISAHIEPYLSELIERLRRQIDDDSPFLADERRRRLEKLERLMMNPELANSEKFRKVMEAVMIEAEYGRTIEVYQETIEVGGSAILANIFRLGRIGLFYQTLDGKACGFYNVAAAAWDPLPKAYRHTIQSAIDIGTKRRPVELLSLPIGRMAPR